MGVCSLLCHWLTVHMDHLATNHGPALTPLSPSLSLPACLAHTHGAGKFFLQWAEVNVNSGKGHVSSLLIYLEVLPHAFFVRLGHVSSMTKSRHKTSKYSWSCLQKQTVFPWFSLKGGGKAISKTEEDANSDQLFFPKQMTLKCRSWCIFAALSPPKRKGKEIQDLKPKRTRVPWAPPGLSWTKGNSKWR